jgi:hypothetical protein
MDLTLPLDKMTTTEKLKALEDIWADLQRAPDQIPVPGWHHDVLRARKARVSEGTSIFTEWESAKERIRKQAK